DAPGAGRGGGQRRVSRSLHERRGGDDRERRGRRRQRPAAARRAHHLSTGSPPPQPAAATATTREGADAALPVPRRAGRRRHRRAVAGTGATVGVSTIEQIIEGAEICVCAGAGGVGKTSTSAAVALGAAERGRKAAVLTIDPAKRLANALGLERLGNEPRRVRGIEGDGELWAMMLDAKRTFDDLGETYAADARARDPVLSNRL